MADNIMGQVMGEIGSSVQPKDNPNPFSPPQDAEAAVAQNSMPNPAQARPMQQGQPPQASPSPAPTSTPQPNQPQASQPAPSGDDDSEKTQRDINSLFSEIKAKDKSKSVADLFHPDKISGLFQGIEQARTDNVDKSAPIIDPKKPNESGWDWAMKQIPNQLKFVGAQMRSHLGRDPIEQRQAFESMYGADNVKTVGKDLYFRPEPDSKFRKIDQKLYNSITDFVLFQALNAVPAAANAVGNVAGNVVTDLVTDNPIAGRAVGGAVGGLADSSVRSPMISLLNTFSSKSQDHASYVNDTLKSMGFGALGSVALGPVFEKIGGAISYPVRKYGGALIESLDSALPKLTGGVVDSTGIKMGSAPVEEAAMKKAGGDISKLAKVRLAFQEFSNYFFPNKVPDGTTAGDYFHTALDETNQRLGQAVGLVKDEALSMADQTGKKVSMAGTLQNIKDTLQSNGVKFDPDTGKALTDSFDQKLMKSEVAGQLNNLSNFYNAISDNETSQGGTHLQDVYKYIDRMDTLSKWGKGDNSVDKEAGTIIRNMYRKIHNGATTDRNSFLTDLYKGSDSPNALMWEKAFQKYGQSADAVASFNAIASSPEERALFMQSLTQAPNADKLELIRRTKQMLGVDSDAWNAFKGEYYNQLLNKHTSPVDGVLDTAGFAKALGNPKTDVLVGELFDDKERAVLNRMLIEGNKISKQLGVDKSTGDAMQNGMQILAKITSAPKDMVRMVFGLFGGKKEQIDYLMNRGFMEAAQNAESPQLKAKFYQAAEMTEGLVEKMNIIATDPAGKISQAKVTTIQDRAQKKYVEKYVPYFSGVTNATLFNKFAEPFKPGLAPNPQQPQPTQGE